MTRVVSMRGAGESETFAVGEVRAIRTFRLGRDDGLYPLYTALAWRPGGNTAACKRGRGHVAPDPDCRCGFYAYGDPAWTVAQPPGGASPGGRRAVGLTGGSDPRGAGRARTAAGPLAAPPRPGPPRTAVRARSPDVEVLRDRDALLQRHPLTALEGYRGPRLAGHARRVIGRLLAVLAALVGLVGCLPAAQLIVSAPGAII